MKVLYVEDNAHDADLTRRALATLAPGVTLDVAPTLREAIARLTEDAGFDLVLADLALPDGTGLDLLGYIRTHEMPLPVVIMTGSGDQDSAIAALKSGADDYLTKRDDYLTRLPQTLARAAARFRDMSARRARPIRVLYAEHNAFDIDLTRRHLAQHTPHIQLEVVNGSEGVLARLSRNAAEDPAYDVVLLDYRLPGIDALEVIKMLREERDLKLPIVLVTGQGNEELAAQALHLGVDDYLTKHAGYLFELPATLEKVHRQAELEREQTALRESKQRYDELVSRIPAGVYRYRVSSDGSERLDYVSPRFCEMLDVEMGAALADIHIAYTRVHPDDLPGLVAAIEEVTRSVTPFSWEGRIVVRGETRWIHLASIPKLLESGDIVWDGIQLDITERKQTEARLRLQDAALAASANAIVITDNNAVILWANPAFTTLTGFSLEEALGKRPKDLVKSGLQSQEFYRVMWQTILSGQVWHGEIINRHKNGMFYHEELTITPVPDEQGAMGHFIAVKQDITERKQLHHIQQVRNEVLDQIIANCPLPAILEGIAHQLEAIHPEMLVSILLLDRQSGKLGVGAAPSLPDFYNAAVEGLEPKPAAGSCGTAAYLGETVVAEDLSSDPNWAPYREITRRAGLGACWSAPFKDDTGKVLGTFGIYYARPRTPTALELALITEFARIAGLAVQKSRLEAERRQAEQRFRATFDQSTLLKGIVAQDGTLLMANQAALDLIGTQEPDVVGQPFWDTPWWRGNPVQQECLKQAISRAVEGQVTHFEATHSKPDGSALVVDCGVSPVLIGNETQVLVAGFDITERKHMESMLRQASAVLACTRDGVMVTDLHAHILSVNPAFTEITGYAEAEVLGRNPSMLQSGRQGRSFYQSLWNCLTETGHWQGEIWNRRKNGEIYPEWITISTVQDEHGKANGYVGVFSDISQIKQSEARLEHLAHYDVLTQLPNRLLLFSRLEHSISLAQRDNKLLALLMLDLDRFKDVNDSFGHLAGDELLQQVAQRLAARLRGVDTVCRLGGDEFTVLLEEIAQPEDAARVASEIIATLSEPWRLSNGAEVRIGASVGISLFPDHGHTAGELLQQADTSLYQAKIEGRGNFKYFSEELTRSVRARIELEARLRRAIQQDELRVYYQPQLNIASGHIIGAEALVRWQDPEEGVIPPGRFIPIAEETGLITAIGNWVLKETCRQGKRWIEAGLPPLTLAVNLSPQQFLHGDIEHTVAETLAETGFPATRLELELTESALMAREMEAIQILNRLRLMGVRLAIDDFGTGYSSLAYLKRFPLDVLKIDKSFIDDIPYGHDDMTITATVIAMSHTLRLTVLAEGVETHAQLEFLKAEGCDAYQGYLASPPVDADAFGSLLKTWEC